MNDLFDLITVIVDRIKGIIQDSLGQCTMNINLIDKIMILEEEKAIDKSLVKMWNI